ncbi:MULTISPECIES: hypothetical protein [Streptomyces]|uniref:Lipoprotein n=1 Tax=Streptomyces griseofuscus TaxID=146922 RepID=A0A7H1QC75_9ACTN|nr:MULTISPECIES: hypothetical protein [Streptomyces]MBA9043399.1 hypothetical protein [Streptomyces murinus]QNT97905.1 hypothetical protein HEP81_07673 [Streptomyces griseofuscus]BBC98522.1 hypothetical protein SRO_7346 [Streptomyces rochei]
MRSQPRTTVDRCVLTIAGPVLTLVGCRPATARTASRLPLTAPGGTLRTHAVEQALTERATSIDGA